MPQFVTRTEWERWAKTDKPSDQRAEVIPALRKFGACEIVKQEIDPVTGMTDIDFVISTPALDRDSDIISVDGWEVEQYLQNPVVLWAHDYRLPPVGRSVKVWRDGDRLLSRDRFTPKEVNPFGHMVYQLIAGKFLSATSVGFRPLEYVYNEDHKGYDFQRTELLEHSIVPVPANPEALSAAAAKGVDLEPLREWAEIILDRDPNADTVALWLPKEAIAAVYKATSRVAVSLSDTGTSDDAVPRSDASSSESPIGGDPVSKAAPITPSGEDDPVTDPENEINDGEEALMKDAIQALCEVVKELNATVKALPESISEKVVERMAEKTAAEPETKIGDGVEATDDDPTDEFSEDDFKSLVKESVAQALIATTGRLPD